MMQICYRLHTEKCIWTTFILSSRTARTLEILNRNLEIKTMISMQNTLKSRLQLFSNLQLSDCQAVWVEPLLFGDRLLPTKQPVQIVSGGCNYYTTQQLLFFFQQWKNKSGNCRFFLVARRLLFCFYSCVTIVCHFKCCALISPLVKAEPNIFRKCVKLQKRPTL